MGQENLKKICIAIHGLAHAGAERVAATWSNYLVSQGHSVVVLVYAHDEDSYDLDDRVKIVPIADTQEEYASLSKGKQLLRMRRIIRDESPEIVISFLPKMQINMMLATIGMRIKRIETVRNNPWTDTDVVGKRLLWNLCFHRSDNIIVQTKEQLLYFSRRLQRKCVVICNPVSNDFSANQKVYDNEETNKFVAVARINPQKNYPMMIRAFAQIAEKNNSCTLDIYGGGTPEALQDLRNLIERLGMGENIRLCGWRRDISELLVFYDAFLLSSNYEGMPNALAEAMAAGLVCLSTDCRTGPKDMIDSGTNGFLADTGNEQSFAEGIEAVTRMNLQQRIAMGNEARKKILTMASRENTLERLNQLIGSV